MQFCQHNWKGDQYNYRSLGFFFINGYKPLWGGLPEAVVNLLTRTMQHGIARGNCSHFEKCRDGLVNM